MTRPESGVLVPLRSNAHGLIAGAPVATVRRRLKTMSLLYDAVLIERGVVRISAGPGGSFAAHESPQEDVRQKWQTSRERSEGQKAGFVVNIGLEDEAGVPATSLRPFIKSEATISWDATLEPLLRELPRGANWFQGLTLPAQLPSELRRYAQDWKRRDATNETLKVLLPERFVRDLVVKNADHDLLLGAAGGVAVSMDRLHQRVASSRLADEGSWVFRGFALPILFPQVGGYPWEDIIRLRRHPSLTKFRALLAEVEATCLQEAAQGGDLERLLQRSYARKMSQAQDQVLTTSGIAKKASVSIVTGLVADVATWGLTPLPTGTVVGIALGTVVPLGVETLKGRRRWLTMDALLRRSELPGT